MNEDLPRLTTANLIERRDSFMRLERRVRRFAVYIEQVRGRLTKGQTPAADPARWLEPPAAPTPKGIAPPPQSSGA